MASGVWPPKGAKLEMVSWKKREERKITIRKKTTERILMLFIQIQAALPLVKLSRDLISNADKTNIFSIQIIEDVRFPCFKLQTAQSLY